MIALKLIYEFFITGLFAFGGGLATLPFLYDMSARTGWFSENDIMNMIAVSEASPGPLGVNMATYVGFITLGFYGGIIASLALVLPSVVIIIFISRFLDKYKNSPIVDGVFHLLRPASAGLIASAGLVVAKTTFFSHEISSLSFAALNWKCIIFAIILLLATNLKKLKLHPIIYIVLSAAVGIAFSL